MRAPRRAIGFALITVAMASGISACFGGKDQLTIENRTTMDVVLADSEDGPRYLIPACGRIVIEDSNGPQPLDRSAPLPPASVLLRFPFPGHFETATIEAVTITSERITRGAYPSLPPCEGVPPERWRYPE